MGKKGPQPFIIRSPKMPEVQPPIGSGMPVGSSQSGSGGAYGAGVCSGKAWTRPWSPTSGESKLRCRVCGLLFKSEEAAAGCCPGVEPGVPRPIVCDPGYDAIVCDLVDMGYTRAEIAFKLGVRGQVIEVAFRHRVAEIVKAHGKWADWISIWRANRRKEVGLPPVNGYPKGG